MKRFMSNVVAFTMIAGTLAGCGNGASSSSSSDSSGATKKAGPKANVTLQFYDWADEQTYMDEVVKRFNEKDPSIQVQVNFIPSDEYFDKTMVMFASGSFFDIAAVNGIDYLNKYISKNFLMDISDYITKEKVNVIPFGPMYNQLAVGGNQYALPYRRTTWLLFYNPDIFDRAGIPYPKQMTWDEYAQLAKRLTSDNGATKQWGGYWVPWIKNFYAVQEGVSLLDDNTAELKKSAEWMNRFYNVDQSHMSLKEMNATKSSPRPEFEKGNIAMLPQGDWTIGSLEADEKAGKTKIKWDIAPMPVPEGVAPDTSWGEYTFLGINSNSKKKDAAFKFIEFASSEEAQGIIAEKGILPAYNSESTKQKFIQAVNKPSARIIFNAKLEKEFPPNPYIGEVANAYDEEMNLYLLGEQTINKAMANFESRRKAVLVK